MIYIELTLRDISLGGFLLLHSATQQIGFHNEETYPRSIRLVQSQEMTLSFSHNRFGVGTKGGLKRLY